MSEIEWEFEPIIFQSRVEISAEPEIIGWNILARFSPDGTIVNEQWRSASGLLQLEAPKTTALLAVDRVRFVANIMRDMDKSYKEVVLIR